MTKTFTSAMSGFARIVVESIRAARAYDAANSNARRRAVLDRFISESDPRHMAVETPVLAVDDGRLLPSADHRVAA